MPKPIRTVFSTAPMLAACARAGEHAKKPFGAIARLMPDGTGTKSARAIGRQSGRYATMVGLTKFPGTLSATANLFAIIDFESIFSQSIRRPAHFLRAHQPINSPAVSHQSFFETTEARFRLPVPTT